MVHQCRFNKGFFLYLRGVRVLGRRVVRKLFVIIEEDFVYVCSCKMIPAVSGWVVGDGCCDKFWA